MGRLNLWARALAVAAACFSLCAQAAVPRYKVEGIGDPGLARQTFGMALNNLGQVAGYSLTDGGRTRVPFLYQDGRMGRIEGLDGVNVFSISSLNDRGDVAGSALFGSSSFLPFVLHDGQALNLGAVLGARHGEVKSLNQAGHAVGYFYAEQGGFQSFYADGARTQVFPDLDITFVDINDHDVIIHSQGYVIDGDRSDFVPRLSDQYALNTLRAIDNAGRIVGRSSDRDGTAAVPFLYDRGVTSSLGSLGGSYGEATDINNRGWVVGYSETAPREVDAFLFRDGGMHNLEELLVARQQGRWDFEQALHINDRGQILVQLDRLSPTGYATALLTPVPEAQSWALMLCGLGVVGAVVVRRQRRGGA